MPSLPERSRQDINEAQLSPDPYGTPAYVPIDPFKPSLAFSLRNLSPESPTEGSSALEDDRPPIRAPRRQGPQYGSTAKAGDRRYYAPVNSIPSARPAWRTVHPRVKIKTRSPPSTQNLSARRVESRWDVPLEGDIEQGNSRAQNNDGQQTRIGARPHRVELRPGLVLTSEHVTTGPILPSISSPTSSMGRIPRYHPGSTDPQPQEAEAPMTDSRHRSYDERFSLPENPVHDLSTSTSPVAAYAPPAEADADSYLEVPHHSRSSLSSPLPPRSGSRSGSHSLLASISTSNFEPETCTPPPSAPPSIPPPPLPMPANERRSWYTSPNIKVHDSVMYNVHKTDNSSSTSTPFRPESQQNLNSSPQAYAVAFLVDTLPRQIYLNLLLRLPYLYFSRVTHIFEEAEMSMPMIRQGILDAARANAEKMGQSGTTGQSASAWGWGIELEPTRENAAYMNLQNTWLAFVDSLLKEWKTLNIISVLLLSAILTILQIESAASDPLTRYSALLSMICALMSLVYGCIYIIRFGTMKKTYKGAAWAQEAQRFKTGIWWNIWVLLAMPATWLAWSVILYIVTITAFIWRTSPFQSQTPPDITATSTSPQILIPRILISTILSLGIVYFILIALTLRRYGEMMDRAWQKRIWGWMKSADKPEAAEAAKDQVWGSWEGHDWGISADEKKGFEPQPQQQQQQQQQHEIYGQSCAKEAKQERWGTYNHQAFACSTGHQNLHNSTEHRTLDSHREIYRPRNIDGWGLVCSWSPNSVVGPANRPSVSNPLPYYPVILPVTGDGLENHDEKKDTGDAVLPQSALQLVESSNLASVMSADRPSTSVARDLLPSSHDEAVIVPTTAAEHDAQLSSGNVPSIPPEANPIVTDATTVEVAISKQSSLSLIIEGSKPGNDDQTAEPVATPISPSRSLRMMVSTAQQSNSDFIKLFDLPLSESCLDVTPSDEELRKCGLNLDAFGVEYGGGNGWNDFKQHIHALYDTSQSSLADFSTVTPDSLSFVLDLWNTKLQFNGITGFLASCESRPGDPGQAIYYFYERNTGGSSSLRGDNSRNGVEDVHV